MSGLNMRDSKYRLGHLEYSNKSIFFIIKCCIMVGKRIVTIIVFFTM